MKPDETNPIEGLLRRQMGVTVPSGGLLCGDPELLAAYAENALDLDSREQFQNHLATCHSCREAVVRLVRMAPREAISAPAPSRWKQWLWAPALASVIIVGSVLWMNRERVADTRQTSQVKPGIEKPAKDEPGYAPVPVTKESASVSRQKRVAPPVAAPAPPPKVAVDASRERTEAELRDEKKIADAVMQSEKTKQESQQVASTAAGRAVQVQPQEIRTQAAPAPSLPAQMQNQYPASTATPSKSAATYESVAVDQQKAQDAAGNKPRMLRMAEPMATSAKRKDTATAPPKGRIEKGVLQLSTDGGATWQAILTPEDVVSFKFTDALNGEITTRSLSVYQTKDGGKTWHLTSVR